MGVLRVDHPDIREFVTCKVNEDAITNFNISVGVTDAFMQAVKDDTAFDLISPHNGELVETVRAREIFDLIVKLAHHNGEPGILFLDTANRNNPLPHLYELEATNPCGEQPLLFNESCNLGSINISKFVNKTRKFLYWNRLKETVKLAVRFLDNVIDVNHYPIPEIEKRTLVNRKIGLGIMGFWDTLVLLDIRYDSEKAFLARGLEAEGAVAALADLRQLDCFRRLLSDACVRPRRHQHEELRRG